MSAPYSSIVLFRQILGGVLLVPLFVPLLLSSPALAVSKESRPLVLHSRFTLGDNERLLITPPPGWTSAPSSYPSSYPGAKLYPPGQTEENWSQVLSIQIRAFDKTSAQARIDAILTTGRERCEVVEINQTSETPVDGYPAASMAATCPKNRQSDKGNVVWFQVLRGETGLYDIGLHWRGESFAPGESPNLPPDMLPMWAATLKSIHLCDPSKPSHPCP